MENPLKNFLNLRKDILGNVRHLDQFGGVMGFKINGMDTYKTKYGFCITMLFYLFILLAITYYIRKYLDKTSPLVQNYRSQSLDYLSVFQYENWVFSSKSEKVNFNFFEV